MTRYCLRAIKIFDMGLENESKKLINATHQIWFESYAWSKRLLSNKQLNNLARIETLKKKLALNTQD